MGVQVEFDSSDLGSLNEQLANFERLGTRRKIVRSGVNALATPYKRDIRKNIRKTKSIRFKYLLRTIISKSKIFSSGRWYVVIGAKNQKQPTGHNAGNYYHLVDGGVDPHDMRKPSATTKRKRKFRKTTFALRMRLRGGTLRAGDHPGFAARNIRSDAMNSVGNRGVDAFWDKTRKALDREWDKQLKKKALS